MSRRRPRSGERARGREAGFSFLELLVAMTIVVIVMTVVYMTLDLNSNIARVQTSVSEAQQSLRYAQRELARRVRMTGRSGLPRDRAIQWRQNVLPGTTVAGVPVVPGTDILTVRGAFSSPIYRVDAGDATTYVDNGTTAQIIVDSVTKSGFLQPVDPLASAPAEEAVMIVSRQTDTVFAVVGLASVTVAPGLSVEIQNKSITVNRATLVVNKAVGTGTNTESYLRLSAGNEYPPDPSQATPPAPTFPGNLTSALYVTVIEEYRYFIQEDYAIPGDATSLPTPKLVVARMTPGTENVYGGDATLASQVVAENVLDLQVALGIDVDGNGRVLEVQDDAGNPVAADADEWYRNDPDDDQDPTYWGLTTGGSSPAQSLQYLRVSLLVRTSAPDRQYVSPPITNHLDRVYGEPVAPSGSAVAERRFRRRQLENLIDLRNL